MGAFLDGIDQALRLTDHRFQGTRGDEARAVLASGDYRTELEPADACVESFLFYELQPGAAEPVGGHGKASLGPLLRDAGDSQAVREAVAVTVGMGYLTWLAVESGMDSEFRPDRGSQQLWDWWVSLLRPTVMSRYALPTDFVLSCRAEGSEYLLGELGQQKVLPGRLRRGPVKARCELIAVLGIVLRLGQTNEVDDKDFEEPQGGEMASTWPFKNA